MREFATMESPGRGRGAKLVRRQIEKERRRLDDIADPIQRRLKEVELDAEEDKLKDAAAVERTLDGEREGL